MSKILTAAALASAILSTSVSPAKADPCSSVLCMMGLVEGVGVVTSCGGFVADFFSLRQFGGGGVFLPGATAALRMAFLSQCSAADPSSVSAIISAFGAVYAL